MKKSLLGLALLALAGSSASFALPANKPVTASVLIKPQNSSRSRAAAVSAQPQRKTVVLMNLPLTARQKTLLKEFSAVGDSSFQASASAFPRHADIGMNGVPVLDQGQHGTCVTFAVSATLDALLGKGDYLSQLCSLELGSYFEEKGYLPSGWDGSMGAVVLNEMLSFGVVSKDKQKIAACGGLKDYPTYNANTIGTAMTLEDFRQHSENLNENIYWDSMLSMYQRFQWDPRKNTEAEALLSEVKKVLAVRPSWKDVRLTFAALLPVNYCSAGACAHYHTDEDTWALTREIKNDQEPVFGGHQMVITAFDDDAIAIDHEGVKHKGLLTLRNSWGSEAGDKGNYYMTYDFFKQFVAEVQQVVLLKE